MKRTSRLNFELLEFMTTTINYIQRLSVPRADEMLPLDVESLRFINSSMDFAVVATL